jgi:fructuronate reductase
VSDAGAQPYADRAGSMREVLTVLAPDLDGDQHLIAETERLLQESKANR